jgi:wyosine [tRNA(Phe)-imidazoG37] synthetase (radical SAM superfamily)
MSSRVRNNRGRQLMAKAGLPMIIFLVGGTYVLSTFMQTHFEVKDKKLNSTSTRKFDLAEEHRKIMGQLDIDDFSLSRIPRPGEEKGNPKKKEKKPRESMRREDRTLEEEQMELAGELNGDDFTVKIDHPEQFNEDKNKYAKKKPTESAKKREIAEATPIVMKKGWLW